MGENIAGQGRGGMDKFIYTDAYENGGDIRCVFFRMYSEITELYKAIKSDSTVQNYDVLRTRAAAGGRDLPSLLLREPRDWSLSCRGWGRRLVIDRLLRELSDQDLGEKIYAFWKDHLHDHFLHFITCCS
ncbi:unnamed protein product [Parnassius mnemosyne]|uniref:Uncharacterized protein n=1 Tax=Parnassius mnemosyne TaxID=213953 RepID=A0AAV1LEU3_9NEOP